MDEDAANVRLPLANCFFGGRSLEVRPTNGAPDT